MNKVLLHLITLCVVRGSALPQARPGVKGSDRPVFVSAQELAEDCRTLVKWFPDGKPLPEGGTVRISPNEMIAIRGCHSYIAGVNDAEAEHGFPRPYHPVHAQLSDEAILINTFLKYVSDHPEEGDFAASTILGEVGKIMRKAQSKH